MAQPTGPLRPKTWVWTSDGMRFYAVTDYDEFLKTLTVALAEGVILELQNSSGIRHGINPLQVTYFSEAPE